MLSHESCSVWSDGLTLLLCLCTSSCRCSTYVSVGNMAASLVKEMETGHLACIRTCFRHLNMCGWQRLNTGLHREQRVAVDQLHRKWAQHRKSRHHYDSTINRMFLEMTAECTALHVHVILSLARLEYEVRITIWLQVQFFFLLILHNHDPISFRSQKRWWWCLWPIEAL